MCPPALDLLHACKKSLHIKDGIKCAHLLSTFSETISNRSPLSHPDGCAPNLDQRRGGGLPGGSAAAALWPRTHPRAKGAP